MDWNEMRTCTPNEGRIVAANIGTAFRINRYYGIVRHNLWVDLANGEQHQVGIELLSNASGTVGMASGECIEILRRRWPELLGEQSQ